MPSVAIPDIARTEVQALCRSVVAEQQPVYVEHCPLPGKPLKECFPIVTQHVTERGGSQVMAGPSWNFAAFGWKQSSTQSGADQKVACLISRHVGFLLRNSCFFPIHREAITALKWQACSILSPSTPQCCATFNSATTSSSKQTVVSSRLPQATNSPLR